MDFGLAHLNLLITLFAILLACNSATFDTVTTANSEYVFGFVLDFL